MLGIGYGSASFQWDQAVQKGSFDCDACNGKTGKCQQCTSIEWDTSGVLLNEANGC